MGTLYEIDAKIRDFDFETDPDTGEILNADAFDALQMERDAKLENIACYFKNLNADAKAIKDEEAALKKRREALERKAEWLKGYLAKSLDGQKFHSPRADVTFRKAERLEVNQAALAIEWLEDGGFKEALRYKEPEIDKATVKRYLKDGVEIPGVKLKEIQSVTIK